jgi:hypothetical protein
MREFARHVVHKFCWQTCEQPEHDRRKSLTGLDLHTLHSSSPRWTPPSRVDTHGDVVHSFRGEACEYPEHGDRKYLTRLGLHALHAMRERLDIPGHAQRRPSLSTDFVGKDVDNLSTSLASLCCERKIEPRYPSMHRSMHQATQRWSPACSITRKRVG